jgi:heme/copper-type cytochrome/quinol oxidase subunit 4
VNESMNIREKTELKKKVKLYLVMFPAIGVLGGIAFGLISGIAVLNSSNIWIIILPALIPFAVMWNGFKKLFNKIDEL